MKQAKFKDFFSTNSKEYASSRPQYPRPLFEFLVGLVQCRNLAWDCATGNGQAAVFLSEYFEQLVASDASKDQIETAHHRNNIRYKVFPAERSKLADNSVDLIAIAQALHWFDLDVLYKDAKRVLRKNGKDGGGVIAAWAYGLHSVSREVDNVTHSLYEDILGPYWPKERKIVENRYEALPFPFQEIDTPVFQIELDWSLLELIRYLYTWSSVQEFIKKNNSDPVKQVYDQLASAWGEKKNRQTRRVVWPIHMRIGRA